MLRILVLTTTMNNQRLISISVLFSLHLVVEMFSHVGAKLVIESAGFRGVGWQLVVEPRYFLCFYGMVSKKYGMKFFHTVLN